MSTFLEIFSVCMVLIYLWFAASRRPAAWLFGILASSISCLLFYRTAYWGSFVLNAIYILQGIYGYLEWKWLEPEKKPRYRNGYIQHALIVSICLLSAWGVSRLMLYFGWNEFSLFDLILASGSLAATWLEIRKDNACWWYWIVCNAGYMFVYLFPQQGGVAMPYYAVLMLILALFSVYALFRWTGSEGSDEQAYAHSDKD